MKKKLYFKFSDGHDMSNVIMELSGCVESIKQDIENLDSDDLANAEYVLQPVVLTNKEFNELPEADF